MLSAVSGLAFLLSTLLKLDNSLGYFLPLPIAIAACRSGVAAAWWTMMATAFLLLGGRGLCVLCFCGWWQPVRCIGCVCWLHMLGDGRALHAVRQQHGGS
jgi:hypothetical protein